MSVYGNPQPYADAELERFMLEGRITAARRIAEAFAGLPQSEKWMRIADELLDHLAEVDARAASRALESVF